MKIGDIEFGVIEIILFIMAICLLTLVIYKEYILYNNDLSDGEGSLLHGANS